MALLSYLSNVVFLDDLWWIALTELLNIVETISVFEAVAARFRGRASAARNPAQEKLFPARLWRHVCKFFVLEVKFLRFEDGLDVPERRSQYKNF